MGIGVYSLTTRGLIIFILIMLPHAVSAAENVSCYETFYQTKDTGCIDVLIKEMSAHGSGADGQKAAINPGLVGFFGEIFAAYPQEKSRILRQDAPPAAKPLFIEALYEAGLQDEAQTYASANGFAEAVKNMQSGGLVPLKQIEPLVIPADNDVLIGAYMASGNTEYIRKILQNFSSADNSMVSDSLRLSMMQGKFGPTLAPSGRKATIVQAACQKYECKKDMHNMMRVMTLSSAFWAISSLSQRDDGIKKIFTAFFESDARLKRLLATESNDFSNYLTTLTAVSAIKNNPNIEFSLSIYEKLGSGKEARDALVEKKN